MSVWRERRKWVASPNRQATKVCEQCGVTFARPRVYSAKQWEERRYCSRSCAWKGRAREQVEITCEGCGKMFRVKLSRFKRQQSVRFCSMGCRDPGDCTKCGEPAIAKGLCKYHYRQQPAQKAKAAAAKHRKGPSMVERRAKKRKQTKTCKQCGVVFSRGMKLSNAQWEGKRFCSFPCGCRARRMDPEEVRENKRRYRAERAEKYRALAQEWRDRNREHVRKKGRDRYWKMTGFQYNRMLLRQRRSQALLRMEKRNQGREAQR
jgi:hypothetical protein